MKSNRRITSLVVIMTAVALIVVIAAIFTLYLAAIDAERARLIGTAQSQARLLEAVARFDEIHSQEDNPEGAHMATFSQLQGALEVYPGVGETGEFVIAKLDGDKLQFLLRQRNKPIDESLSIPLDSQLAEPMRRALSGESGTIIGLDYDGIRVLAAYEPVAVLNLGLVAKIDLGEIYTPILRAAAISLAIAIGIIALAVFIFFRVSDPLVRQLEQSHEMLEEIVEDRTAELEKERAQYRDLYVDAPIAYFSVSKDGLIEQVNDHGCQMFGVGSVDLVGTKVFDLYADTSAGKPRAAEVFQRFMQGEQIRNQELQYQRADGELFWGSLTVRTLKDTSGNTILSRSTIVDITERVQAEQDLRASEMNNRQVLESAMEGYILADTQGKIIEVNNAYSEIVGYPNNELLSMNIRDIEATLSDEEVTRRFEQIQTQGRDRFITQHHHKDGHLVDLDVSIVVVPINDQPHVTAFVRDISERIEADGQLKTLKERLELATNSAQIGVWDWDIKEDKLVWDDIMCALYGLQDGGFDGVYQSWVDQLHPDDRKMAEAEVQAALQGEIDFNTDFRVIWPNRKVHHIHGIAAVVRDEKGEPERMIGVNWDVSGRKEAEENARYRLNLLDLLNSSTQQLSENLEIGAVGEIIASTCVEKFGVKMAWIGLAEDDGVVSNFFHFPVDNQYAANIQVRWDDAPEGDGPVGMSIRQNSPVLIGDTASDERFAPWAEPAKGEGFKAVLAVPLNTKNQKVGALTLYSEQQGFFTQELVNFFHTYGQQAAIALENANLHGELRRHADSLEIRVAERTLELAEVSDRLRLAASSARVGIWDWDVLDNVLVWDDTMYEIYGVKRDDFSDAYDVWVKGLHPDDVKSGQGEVDAALAGTKDFDSEFRVVWPDGTIRYVHGIAAVQRSEDGKPLRMTGVNWDVTEQKHREQKIVESEARIRAIVSTAVDGILSIDEQGVIHQYNPAAEQIFGYSPDEVIGQNIKMLMPEPYHGEHDGYLDAYQRTGEKKIIGIGREVEGQRKNGQKFPLDLAVSEFWIGDQRLFTGIVRDITERKQTEAELRNAKETAEAASRTKSEFLASMSHELRTPMNAIIGFSELLQQKTFGELNDKQDRYVGNILSSGKHLLNLINDILDISKVEAGRLNLNLEKIEIDAAIQGVQTIVKPLYDKKNIRVDLQITPDLPPLIADPSKFKQMLYNLLSNAIKFTPASGEVSILCAVGCGQWLIENELSPTIENQILPESRYNLITVTDSGIGIQEDDLERVFGEFEQVDSSYARQQQGTGLGLTLTRKLAQLHGGWVWAESEGINTGSTFSLILPLDGPRGAAVGDVVSEEVPSQKPGQNLVLIIEDDPMARELLNQYLSEAGYAILRASDRQGGLTLSRRHKPDVITLDIMLPDAEDGWGLLADLKSDDDTKDIPVVIVSITEDHQRGFAMGAVGWFVKPIQREVLISSLEKLTVGRGKLNVLVIDDDPTVVELLQDILEDNGHAVLSALGGQQGIDLALADKPDVIILDLMMPEVSGFEVVRQLRAQEATVQIPILINTAKELSSVERQELNRHVQSIAPKSKFGQKELLRALTRVVEY